MSYKKTPMDTTENNARILAGRIKAGHTVIFSGAGLSTESGLQDFRSGKGMWADVDPMTLASIDALEMDYGRFLQFYKDRLHVAEDVEPNIGHKLVAKWEHSGYVDGVITQNVDRLHQKAGAKNVWELHGSLEPVRCHRCGKIGNRDDFLGGVPCSCGGNLRPGVVLFGEMLPEEPMEQADELCLHCKTFIVLGSSLVVSPANYFPRKAKHYGAYLAIINRDHTPLDGGADMVVHESIGQFLTAVEDFME